MADFAPRIMHLDLRDVPSATDLLAELQSRELDCLWIHGALPRARREALRDALEDGRFAASMLTPPGDAGVSLTGIPLQWAGSELGRYLEQARVLREDCSRHVNGFDVDEWVQSWAVPLANGRAVRPMAAPDGRPYAACTARRVGPAGSIKPHFEDHQLTFEPCRKVRAELDGNGVLSFFTVLQKPERGGDLVLHDLVLDDLLPDEAAYDTGAGVADHLEGRAHAALAPAEGDLSVLSSGRRAHGVGCVAGERRRWTLGGVLGFAVGGDSIVYWA